MERRMEYNTKKDWMRKTNDPILDRQGKSVHLHQSLNPWRPSREKENGKEEKERVLLRSIKGLLNGASRERKDALMKVFLEYRVHESPFLNEVVSIIFDMAVEVPDYCSLYAALCSAQVGSKLKSGASMGSRFKSEILKKVQEIFNTKTISGKVEDTLRRARMGHINFIGHLYLERLISLRFMHYRVIDLLKSINEVSTDEDLIDCAVRLLEKIGKKMEEEEEKYDG
ncbi:hypothetical protein PENTCL1PPCAC_7167, partial [Pristionchus entomophagus]